MEARRFCPFCASRLEPPVGSVQGCTGCGRPFYHNAKPCAAVIVEDAAGRVLLALRAVEPARGRWDLPGGFCEFDEAPECTAVRELLEETGARVELTGFLGHVIDRYGDAGDHTLNVVYRGRLAAGAPPLRAADDVGELRWFPATGLPWGELAFPNTAEALRRWIGEG